ncbi:hypothetical protein OOZ51_21995 [Arthrobacter sp. MI7-26]|uniref:hypothetical protein n=1 Tax=Arthrobacter sp. MI7-26 TaxID=2993653 RepID=UPI002248994B|nr:hypothetical protein [Arthrobacter sp. MI7-26]MCX2750455.1 hypothetical protein [Arthrobacter sp. MI7-26]
MSPLGPNRTAPFDPNSDNTLTDRGVLLAEVLAHSGLAWGIKARDVPALSGASGPDAVVSAIRDVAALGCKVLVLTSVRQASPSLDRGELRAIRAEASRLAVQLQADLGSFHPDRYDHREVGAALEAGTTLGIVGYHVTFGIMDDRFLASPTWPEQLKTAVGPLRELVDRAESTVVMRTHEEMTTFELASLCASVGREALQVGFSPVNVVTRLEDPTAAFDRVAVRVNTLYLDDCWVARTRDGASRRLCPLGHGAVNWERLLAYPDPRTIAVLDVHHAQFDMPFYQREWLAHHPDLRVPEFLRVMQSSIGFDLGQTSFEERRIHGRRVLERATAVRERASH